MNSCIDSVKTDHSKKPITTDIQQLLDLTKKRVDFVYNELSKIYPYIIINAIVDLPETA